MSPARGAGLEVDAAQRHLSAWASCLYEMVTQAFFQRPDGTTSCSRSSTSPRLCPKPRQNCSASWQNLRRERYGRNISVRGRRGRISNECRRCGSYQAEHHAGLRGVLAGGTLRWRAGLGFVIPDRSNTKSSPGGGKITPLSACRGQGVRDFSPDERRRAFPGTAASQRPGEPSRHLCESDRVGESVAATAQQEEE